MSASRRVDPRAGCGCPPEKMRMVKVPERKLFSGASGGFGVTEREGMGVTERETAPFVSFVSFVDSAGALAILGPSRGPRRVRTLHAELPGHCWGKRGGC